MSKHRMIRGRGRGKKVFEIIITKDKKCDIFEEFKREEQK